VSGRAPRQPSAPLTNSSLAGSLFPLDLGSRTTLLQVCRHPQARRISLRIAADGDGVVVVVPAGIRPEAGIDHARRNIPWIRARLATLPPRVAFADGAVLPVLGCDLLVRHRTDQRAGVRQEGSILAVGGGAQDLPRRLTAWLRAAARAALTASASGKAAVLGRSPAAIAVRDTRSRWGSCSSKGALSFSWRLIFAPPTVLDYVVAHEMAHLRVRGHGPDFWRTVALLGGDVEDARGWLRQHGRDLFRYG
jgi:predicted metal-dependent hydrolase